MIRDLSCNWLLCFDTHFARTQGQRVALVIDNASCHENIEKLPQIHHVDVIFLPKNSTSRRQSLDLGIIVYVKRRYRRRQIERVVDFLELGEMNDLYKTDLHTTISNVNDIWNSIEGTIIHNCWAKTQLIDASLEN